MSDVIIRLYVSLKLIHVFVARFQIQVRRDVGVDLVFSYVYRSVFRLRKILQIRNVFARPPNSFGLYGTFTL